MYDRMSETESRRAPSEKREEVLFTLALEKPVAERAAFLEIVCGAEKALQDRLKLLLAAHEEPETLLVTTPQAARRAIDFGPTQKVMDETVG